MDENEISRHVVDAAFKIHQKLGPGLLESVYEEILAFELERRGLKVRRQVPVSFEYEGRPITNGFRLDLLVEDKVAVELKVADELAAVHRKQALTYVRLSELRLGSVDQFRRCHAEERNRATGQWIA